MEVETSQDVEEQPQKTKTPELVQAWWHRNNIIEKLLGPKESPNEKANTFPAGAD